MIGYNRKYKGIDFTDSIQYTSKVDNGYAIFLQNEEHQTTTSMNSTSRANYHGGYSSEVLINPRYFNFTGKIVGHTKELRHEAWNTLVSAIQPEHNPASPSFYDLTFKDDGGNDRLAYVKVETAPQNSNGLDDPIIEFSFTLYSETEKIYSSSIKAGGGGIGIIGGNTFSTTFPTIFTGYGGSIICNNEGNRPAPIKITAIGTAVNPRLINTTNGQKYRIGKTTTNLVFDNRNVNNAPNQRLVVLDSGVDIRGYRTSGAGIYLEPGINNVVLIDDGGDPNTTVTVTRRDTFIY